MRKIISYNRSFSFWGKLLCAFFYFHFFIKFFSFYPQNINKKKLCSLEKFFLLFLLCSVHLFGLIPSVRTLHLPSVSLIMFYKLSRLLLVVSFPFSSTSSCSSSSSFKISISFIPLIAPFYRYLV